MCFAAGWIAARVGILVRLTECQKLSSGYREKPLLPIGVGVGANRRFS
jgi:hypothetical protein